MYFDFTGEERKDEFEFHSWHPRRDTIFLGMLVHASETESDSVRRDVQVFDLSSRHVRESFPSFSGVVAWSKDGKFLILSRGDSLVFDSVALP